MDGVDDLPYRVALTRIPGVGRVRLQALEGFFGGLEAAWQAGEGDLSQAGLDRRTVQAVVAWRPRLSPQEEMERLARYNVRALVPEDADYPPLLREIDDVPPVLYVRGGLEPRDRLAVAVVGTRQATAYGREVAEELVTGLARYGVTVVSGLAKGIDYVAHRAALEAKGRTIAVQACGLDLIYPASHAALAREIMDGGALISDYALGTRPRAEFFPRRNRIMSGMALATLVVEADQGSGALITARLALEQNREVMAVPGSIFSPASRGTIQLIQAGAKAVATIQDILEELNVTAIGQAREPAQLSLDLSPQETRLLGHLTREPVHIDELSQRAGLPVPEVSSALVLLELNGLARQVGAMHFVLTREAQAEYRVGA